MAAFFPTSADAAPIVADASPAVVSGPAIVNAPIVQQSAPLASPFDLTSGLGAFGAAPFGGLSSFGGLTSGVSALPAPYTGFTTGFNDVNAYASGVQATSPFGQLVGPYPAATTLTGSVVPTATAGVNPHNYAGYGYNRPIAYGYEGATLGGPYPRGIPAVNPVVPPTPYAAVGSRAPVPPTGAYGVAKGRFHKGSKRIAGTGANAGERYYYG